MFPRSYKPKTIPFVLLKQELIGENKEKEALKDKNKGRGRKAQQIEQQKEEADKDDEKEEEITTSIEALEAEVMKKF